MCLQANLDDFITVDVLLITTSVSNLVANHVSALLIHF